jgi:Ca-activated chloride channel family protein
MRVELPFSPDRALADGLIDAYLNEFRARSRRPSCWTPAAAWSATAASQLCRRSLHRRRRRSLTGRIARLTNREQLWMQPFSDNPYDLHAFEIPAGAPAAAACR